MEKNIIDEFNVFLSINLNFQDLEEILNDYANNWVKAILVWLKNIYIDKVIEILNKEFIIINANITS